MISNNFFHALGHFSTFSKIFNVFSYILNYSLPIFFLSRSTLFMKLVNFSLIFNILMIFDHYFNYLNRIQIIFCDFWSIFLQSLLNNQIFTKFSMVFIDFFRDFWIISCFFYPFLLNFYLIFDDFNWFFSKFS